MKNEWSISKLQSGDNWKITKPAIQCGICGKKKNNFFDDCTSACEKKIKEKIREERLAAEQKEKERRSKPVTVGEVEDMIESAIRGLNISIE